MRILIAAAAIGFIIGTQASAHDIYTGFVGKGNQLCCGADDCSQTVYQERGSAFYFRTKEGHWVLVPLDDITWLPIPGDKPDGTKNRAHLCYIVPSSPAVAEAWKSNTENAPHHLRVSEDGMQTIWEYCAIIPPGGV